MLDILSRNTGQAAEKIAKDTDRMFYMTPEQAKEYGLNRPGAGEHKRLAQSYASNGLGVVMPVDEILRVPYQVPGSQKWQWINIYTRLSQERIIFLNQPITMGLANSVVSALLYLDSEEHKPINLYINSMGDPGDGWHGRCHCRFICHYGYPGDSGHDAAYQVRDYDDLPGPGGWP